MSNYSTFKPLGGLDPTTNIVLEGNVSRTIEDKLKDIVSVKDFGAVGNNSTDDYASFENAITYLDSIGGGTLLIPSAWYVLSQELKITKSNIFLKGDGHGSTVLSFTATTDSMNGISFETTTSSNQYRGGISDLTITLTGTTQSATSNCYGLQAWSTNDLYFERLSISNFSNGLGILNTANTVRIDTVDVTDIINDAFVVSSPTSQYFINCTAFQNSSPTGSGFNILETGGAQFVNCVTGGSDYSGSASGYQYGINIDPASGKNVQDLQFVNCNIDTSAIAAVNINPNQVGNVTNIEFHNMRSGWGNKYGVIINGSTPTSGSISTTSGVKFIGGSTSRNLQHGVVISGGDNIYFDGFHVRGNGVEISNTYDGYILSGGSYIYISNGMSSYYAGSDGTNTYTQTQRYGINITSTFTGVLVCTSNNFSNNLSGASLNNTSTASIVFSNCQGIDTNISTNTVDVGNGIRTLSNKLKDIVSVKDFGAIGDGTTDDTAAIQSAISYVMSTANNGGEIYFPDGHYFVTSIKNTQYSGLKLLGTNPVSCRIIGSTSGYSIDMSGTNTKSNCVIENIGFYSNLSTDEGTSIFCDNVYNLAIQNCQFMDNVYNAIQIENSQRGTYGVFIRNNWFAGILNNGITLGVNSNTITVPTDIYVSSCGFTPGSANANSAFMVHAVGGLYCTDIDVTNAGTNYFSRAIQFSPTSSQQCNGILMDKVFFDSSNDVNMMFDGEGVIADLTFNNCWFNTSSTNSGVLFGNANLNGCSISNSIIDSNAQNGIVINSGNNINILGCKIFQNAVTTTNKGNYDGIVIGSGVGNFSISGNNIGHGGYFGTTMTGLESTATQRYGINIGASCFNFLITNNRGTGNLSGLINNASTETTILVENNLDGGSTVS